MTVHNPPFPATCDALNRLIVFMACVMATLIAIVAIAGCAFPARADATLATDGGYVITLPSNEALGGNDDLTPRAAHGPATAIVVFDCASNGATRNGLGDVIIDCPPPVTTTVTEPVVGRCS